MGKYVSNLQPTKGKDSDDQQHYIYQQQGPSSNGLYGQADINRRLSANRFSFPDPSRESYLDENTAKNVGHNRVPSISRAHRHKASRSSSSLVFKHPAANNTDPELPKTYLKHRSRPSAGASQPYTDIPNGRDDHHYRPSNSQASLSAETLSLTPSPIRMSFIDYTRPPSASLADISAFVKLTNETPSTPTSLDPLQASKLYSAITTAQYLGISANGNSTHEITQNTTGTADNTGNVGPGVLSLDKSSLQTQTIQSISTFGNSSNNTTSNTHTTSPFLSTASSGYNTNYHVNTDINSNPIASLLSNKSITMPFPHIVRPVPVFVADQLTQSRKTTIASYVSSNDAASKSETSNNGVPKHSSQSMNKSSLSSQKFDPHDSPSGASTSNRHSAPPVSAPGVKNGGSTLPNLSTHKKYPSGPHRSHSLKLDNMKRNSNWFMLPTSNANSTNPSRSVNPSGGLANNYNYGPINKNNIHNGPPYNSHISHGSVNNSTYQIVRSVIVEKQRQLEATANASRWSPFVAATMPLQFPQTSGLSEFETNTRVRPEDLDAQFSLDGDWSGNDGDSRSRTSSSKVSAALNYILCCFMNVDEEGRHRGRYDDGMGARYEQHYDEELGVDEKGAINKTGTAYNQGLYRQSNGMGYNEPYGHHSNPSNNDCETNGTSIIDSSSSSDDSSRPDRPFNKNSGPLLMHPHYGQYGCNVRHYVARKKRKWQPKLFYVLLNNPLIPLTLRLFNFILSIIGLALACSVFIKSRHTAVTQEPSTIMAIVVQTCALVYLIFISYDEYSGKPLGLRDFKDKMRLIMLDLLFIIFSSANLSLAFNTLFDPMWLCQDGEFITVSGPSAGKLDPSLSDPAVCRRQQTLVSFLMVILVSWIITFTISMFRLIERISSL